MYVANTTKCTSMTNEHRGLVDGTALSKPTVFEGVAVPVLNGIPVRMNFSGRAILQPRIVTSDNRESQCFNVPATEHVVSLAKNHVIARDTYLQVDERSRCIYNAPPLPFCRPAWCVYGRVLPVYLLDSILHITYSILSHSSILCAISPYRYRSVSSS